MVIAISVAGLLVAALQAATIFIVSDLRDRIMRIESREMAKADRLRELQGVT